jgi:hypothetical protein
VHALFTRSVAAHAGAGADVSSSAEAVDAALSSSVDRASEQLASTVTALAIRQCK